ncbi:D-amino-acid oxidase-like [Amblyomma americanum]
MSIRVAVVGAGIIGLTSAVRIAEAVLDVDVTVIAENFTPHTTGDVAGGFFEPYLVEGVSNDTLRTWCVETFDFYRNLQQMYSSNALGLVVTSVYELGEEAFPKPGYADAFLEYREMTAEELGRFSGDYSVGVFLISMTVEGEKFLPYLMQRFADRGGRFRKRRLESLNELATEYDVVVNCSGVGARTLVPDPLVIPVRGQTIRVQAPWITSVVVAGDYYIIPNADDIVLGGTAEYGNDCLIPDAASREEIWKACLGIFPELKNGKILGDYVGLRPVRNPLRLELENRLLDDGTRKLPIVHNYGHGGCGLTLSWGCAGDVVRLLRDVIRDARRTRRSML